MTRFAVARFFIGLALLSTPSFAQQQLDVDHGVPMFCRDDRGTYQPIVRTNYGRMLDSFRRQFNFRNTLTTRSPSTGTLTFRGGENDAETISYTVEVHGGGIALIEMRVRLQGVSENVTGSRMCWQTWTIINGV